MRKLIAPLKLLFRAGLLWELINTIVTALLVWVYYASAIFFFGAEFVQAYVEARGERIQVLRHAGIQEDANGMLREN